MHTCTVKKLDKNKKCIFKSRKRKKQILSMIYKFYDLVYQWLSRLLPQFVMWLINIDYMSYWDFTLSPHASRSGTWTQAMTAVNHEVRKLSRTTNWLSAMLYQPRYCIHMHGILSSTQPYTIGSRRNAYN